MECVGSHGEWSVLRAMGNGVCWQPWGMECVWELLLRTAGTTWGMECYGESF